VSLIEVVLALTVLIGRFKELIMLRIGTPLKVPELNLQGEQEKGIELSEDMQQVLSLLTGFSKNRRIVLQSSPVGALRVTSARLIDVVHFTATEVNHNLQGSDVPCSEVMCMGHPDNGGNVWVRTLTEATTANAWPLAAGEVKNFSVDNLRDLQMLIVADTEKLIVSYA